MRTCGALLKRLHRRLGTTALRQALQRFARYATVKLRSSRLEGCRRGGTGPLQRATPCEQWRRDFARLSAGHCHFWIPDFKVVPYTSARRKMTTVRQSNVLYQLYCKAASVAENFSAPHVLNHFNFCDPVPVIFAADSQQGVHYNHKASTSRTCGSFFCRGVCHTCRCLSEPTAVPPPSPSTVAHIY